MKHFIFLITTFLLLGCGRRIVQPVHVQEVPVELTKTLPVVVDTEITIPEETNDATATIPTDKDTTLQWDWGHAATSVKVTPKNEGREADIKVTTTQKARTITVHDTVTVTVTLRDTVTIQPNCPTTLPPVPGEGAGWFDWVWWVVIATAALATAIFGKKQKRA